MKEFDFLIDKALVAGQHTETIGARNRDVLVTAKNMRPTEYGLAFNKAIGDTLVTPPTTAWPYPQLFKGKSETLLADDTKIYSVNETTGVLTELDMYTIASAQTPTGEVVSEGNFAAVTDWTLNSGWSNAGGKLVATAVASGATATQTNINQTTPIVSGYLYRCTYTIDSITSGAVYLNCAGDAGTARTVAGTYSEDLLATSAGSIFFGTATNFTGVIDNLSIKRIVNTLAPTGGGAWHFADFRGVWFLFKENCMVMRLPYYSDNRLIIVKTSVDDFRCNTGENLGNRLFLGGLTAATLLATDNFSDAWTAWVENSSNWSDEMTYADMTLTTNVVMYSTRVGGDVYWPFVVEMALLGLPHRVTAAVVADLKANYIDWIRKGEIGFVPLQHQGAIQCLKRLGNSVVAYGTDGISVISPRDDKGFRATVVHHAGIASRSAVGGDEHGHVFLDTHNILWLLNPDGKLDRLVGTGTFNAMVTAATAHPIICSHDPEEQEYYICSDQEGYIRTRTGIGEITILPTSLITIPSGLEGIVVDLATPDLEVETETFDMGMRALKTIHSVSVGFQDITDLQVVVRYKYDDTNTWRESSAFTINTDSVAVPLFTAKDFRLKFTGTPGTAAKIDYVNVSYQVSDKRNIRSAYEQ